MKRVEEDNHYRELHSFVGRIYKLTSLTICNIIIFHWKRYLYFFFSSSFLKMTSALLNLMVVKFVYNFLQFPYFYFVDKYRKGN